MTLHFSGKQLFDTTFPAETMPLTQAKSNQGVLTHEHGKELISTTASSWILELSFLERYAGYKHGDDKASPSWLCPPALAVQSAVLSNSVPKEGHFRAFSWQVPD